MMKSKKDVTRQIKEVIRQITASVTFLPMIDEPCSFDLLVYTDDDVSCSTFYVTHPWLLNCTVILIFQCYRYRSNPWGISGYNGMCVCLCLVVFERVDLFIFSSD